MKGDKEMNEFDVLYMESKDALYTAFDMMNIYFMESADKKNPRAVHLVKRLTYS